MIRISQLKLPVKHTEEELKAGAAKALRLPAEEIWALTVVKRSIDARKKDRICYSYTVDVRVQKEERTVKRRNSPSVLLHQEDRYRFPGPGEARLKAPPILVGSGPAGLFCGLMLARNGYCPIVLERGADVEARAEAVENFWAGGALDVRSNVQFGEGGAGTFSDGKLNTLVKDPSGRNRKVLELFVEFGADPSVLIDAKPHIGTDVLCGIVKRMREEIREHGGEVRFMSQMTDLRIRDGRVRGVEVNGEEVLDASAVVLAIGHSARDTFRLLEQRSVPMEAKSFAVGLRVQHPQSMINRSQYGMEDPGELGPAGYKLAHQTVSGRGVYTFCMCPGGYVVDASSEPGRLAVNGMSYHDRSGENANSAVIVTVTPEDFPDRSPLGGVAFQRKLEEAAFCQGGGKIPVQLLGDFSAGCVSAEFGDVSPEFRGGYRFADLREVLPQRLCQALTEGMEAFERRIRGFGRPDAILAGVESRTSSPVRIGRGERFESKIQGLFPCGEGAGYAGGITSAAMDGIRVAEELARRYAPLPGGAN